MTGGANGVRTFGTPCGANRKRIGTAKLDNGDERHPLAAIGPEPTISGPDSAESLSQDPRETREFSGRVTGRWCRVSATAD